jgi:uncharacterized membrane protein
MRRMLAPITGLIVGSRFAAKSLEPSLMPRSAIDQGLIMGGSFLTGFVVGAAAGTVAGVVPLPTSGPAARLVAATAASARTAQVFGGERGSQADPRDAWREMGTEVVAGLALAGVGSKKNRPPILQATTGAALVGGTAIEIAGSLKQRHDAPDPKYLAVATGVATGLNLGVAALVGIVLGGGRFAARFARSGPMSALAMVAGSAATAGMIGAVARYGVGVGLGKIAAGNRKTEIEYSTVPTVDTVSGGRYSLAAYDTLGLQGRRLVSEHTPIADIETIMGEPARCAPVRVYVGLGSAADEDQRVELAIRELQRAGGFERSTIIAASPAGTGYVNYIAVEAAELMSRGDVATVAVQYGEVPSMLSITHVGDAARVYAKLIGRLRQEIDALDRQVDLVAYGESLGAITCQMGVLQASESADSLAVDRALWVGTPQGSELFAALTNAGAPVFDHPDQLEAWIDSGNEVPATVLLNHDNDPVTKFTPTVFTEMPDWLATTERGRNVEPNQRWLPGITFWQLLIDTKNAATVVPGEFFSTGHDYRADLAAFVREAYGFEVDETQMEAIEERLRSSEVTRAEKIAAGKVPSDPATVS